MAAGLNVAQMVAGALLGGLVSPWLAVRAGLAPLWAPLAFYLAIGPVRWVRWVVAGAYEESHWSADVVGDAGKAVGVLQYHAPNDATAAVRPDPTQRASPFMSAYFAAALTVVHLMPRRRGRQTGERGWASVRPYAQMRLPVYGYLVWRYSWRHGAPPPRWGAPITDEGAATRQAYEGLAVNIALAITQAALMGGLWAYAGKRCTAAIRRWVRRVR